jgi:hypothetical protein
MWKDTWFMTLDPVDKLLFIYLFSNERADTCGVYEVPFPVLLLETGVDAPRARQGLATLQEAGRVFYDEASGHCFVRNLMRYNGSNLLANAKMRANLRTYRATKGASLRYWDLWCQTYPREAAEVFDALEKEKKEKEEQEENKKAASTPDTPSGVEAAAAAAAAADLPAPPGLEAALHLFQEARQEPANSLDRCRLQEMAASAEAHRLALRPGQPGADRSGAGWVRQAIEDANAARRPGVPLSLKFVEAVLNRWLAEGFRAPWGGHGVAYFEDVEYWPEED